MNYSLTFDDVLIVPKFSNVVSRKDVNIETKLCSQKMFPVISSNMDTITSSEMANAIGNFGGRGCLHRFWSIEDNVKAFKNSVPETWISFGLGKQELERAERLKIEGADTFILDVAHGASIEVVKQVLAFRETIGYHPSLVVGNFATGKSIEDFINALGDKYMVNAYKVGIGGGSACTTRLVTGCGLPTLASLLDCSKANVSLIADGGIRSSGDVAKALAVKNVKAVMLGGMLAGTNETPGDLFDACGDIKNNLFRDTQYYKKYRGSASQESYNVQNKESSWRTPEGEAFLVPCKGPVTNVLQNIDAGLRSAFSYVGAKDLKEFQELAEFITISQNGYKEGTPHGKV